MKSEGSTEMMKEVLRAVEADNKMLILGKYKFIT